MSTTLPFVAAYTKASGSQQVKATGLTVTCSVFQIKLADATMTRLVNAGAATELTASSSTTGVYFYQYAGAIDFTAYWYHAEFTTADTSVQQVDIAAAWFDFPASIAKSATGDLAGRLLGNSTTAFAGVGAEADVQTIKTQAVTCAAPVTVYAAVGSAYELGVDSAGCSTLGAHGADNVQVDGKTLPAALQIMAATTAGKTSGAGTGCESFFALDGATLRVTGTVNEQTGERTAVTYS